MKIIVFSPEIETLGVVSNYNSLTHVRQFAGSGSFKLTAPFTDSLFKLLAEENILYWEDAGKTHAVYIDSVICETETDGQYITASGKNMRGYLGRRIVWDNISFSGTVEDFGRTVVSDAAISPEDPSRTIPLLLLGERKGLSHTITRLTENENIEDLLDTVTAASGVGFDIVLNKTERNLLFIAYEGTDRRITQAETPWAILSRDRNNVVTETYTRSGASFRNAALIAGYTDEQTGTRYEAEINAESGLSRREMFVKGNTSRPKPDADAGETEVVAMARYQEELLQKGREQLAGQAMVLSLEVEPDANLLKRLDVGDKVTAIEKQYSLTAQTYISEITTYYGKEGRRVDLTLGDAIPTIYEKLKKELA